jgi:hypothetical protein
MRIKSLIAVIVVAVGAVVVVNNLAGIAGPPTRTGRTQLVTATSVVATTTAPVATTTAPRKVVVTTTVPVTTTTVPRKVVVTTTVPVTTTTAPRPVATTTIAHRAVPTTTMPTSGLTIVNDGISYCFRAAAPRIVGYWVLFSNGVRAERTVVAYGKIPSFETGEDIVTRMVLPKYLACGAGGTFTFANS